VHPHDVRPKEESDACNPTTSQPAERNKALRDVNSTCSDSTSIEKYISIIFSNKRVTNHQNQPQKPPEGPFKCDTCSRIFPRYHQLREHAFIHKNVNPFQCDICEKSFARHFNLQRHKSLHKDKSNNFTCYICGQTFAEFISLQQHSESRSCKINCNICGKIFGHQRGVSKHYATHRRHKCNSSNKSFIYLKQLQQHALSHEDDNEYTKEEEETHANVTAFECDICEKSFMEHADLEKHKSTHKENSNNYSCHICGETFAEFISLQQHSESRSCRIKCNICGKIFRHQRGVIKHYATHRHHKCNTCNKSFKYFKQLQQHTLSHENNNKYTNGEEEKHTLTRTNVKAFECDICEKSFVRRVNLQRHKSTHKENSKNYACHICGETFAEFISLQQHSESRSCRIKCNICGKIFGHQRGISKHYAIHRRHKCNSCNKSYVYLKQLQQHALSHEDNNKYTDEEEEESLSIEESRNEEGTQDTMPDVIVTDTLTQLHSHDNITIQENEVRNKSVNFSSIPQPAETENDLEITFLGEVPNPKQQAPSDTVARSLKCDTCGKFFASFHELKIHTLTHANMKKFECDICRKMFMRRAQLRKHKKTQHNTNKKEKNFTCDICGKKYVHWKSLQWHLHTQKCKKTRKLHKCNFCDKSFQRLGSLREHALSHKGNKSFKCDVCESSFLRFSDLLRHTSTHEDFHLSENDVEIDSLAVTDEDPVAINIVNVEPDTNSLTANSKDDVIIDMAKIEPKIKATAIKNDLKNGEAEESLSIVSNNT
ncbi:hypothetical protein ANN_00200, partial [Periplaneta americana]